MLLALRSLFEETTPIIVIPPAGRTFKGHGLGKPFLPTTVVAVVTGAEAKFQAGEVKVSAGATVQITGIELHFSAGQPFISCGANAPIIGNELFLKVGNVSVSAADDDDEAMLILGNL